MTRKASLDLLDAAYAWIVATDQVPYMACDSDFPGVIAPDHLRDRTALILNISQTAVKDLSITIEGVSFQARFNGEVCDIFIPEAAIFSMFGKETGCGVTLRLEASVDDAPQSPSSHLKLT